MKSLTAASHSPDSEEEGIHYDTFLQILQPTHNYSYAVFASAIQYLRGMYPPKPPLKY
jgi:hypothetical protein